MIPRISKSNALNPMQARPQRFNSFTWFQLESRHLYCFSVSLCGFSMQPSLRTMASHSWALLFSKTQSWDIKYYRKKKKCPNNSALNWHVHVTRNERFQLLRLSVFPWSSSRTCSQSMVSGSFCTLSIHPWSSSNSSSKEAVALILTP